MSTMSQNSKADMVSVGTLVKNKWKIQSIIGRGAFGETYAAYDVTTNDEVAIKVEKLDNKKMVLRLEVIALKKLQECPQVVRYIHSGRQDGFNFLVMERLQDNLADIRKRSKTGRFSMPTTLKLGIQMIDSLEGTHKLGYIHRDVKPSNFVTGRVKQAKSKIYLIDFGLARRYRLPNGEIRPPRKSAGFRGTARYASINSHKSKELGRRDDLWSVFYVLVEFALGSLPWRKIKDKERIGELKEKYTNKELVRDLPKEFTLFLEHLQKLTYTDEPDYDYLRGLLNQVYVKEGYPTELPFDWDMKESDLKKLNLQISSLIDETGIKSKNDDNSDKDRLRKSGRDDGEDSKKDQSDPGEDKEENKGSKADDDDNNKEFGVNRRSTNYVIGSVDQRNTSTPHQSIGTSKANASGYFNNSVPITNNAEKGIMRKDNETATGRCCSIM